MPTSHPFALCARAHWPSAAPPRCRAPSCLRSCCPFFRESPETHVTHSLTSFMSLLRRGFITDAFSNFPVQEGNSFGTAQMGMPRSKEGNFSSQVTHEAVALQTATWLLSFYQPLCRWTLWPGGPSIHSAYRMDLSNFCHTWAIWSQADSFTWKP